MEVLDGIRLCTLPHVFVDKALHSLHCLPKFKTRALRYRRGTEEQCGQKQHLLQYVYDLAREFEYQIRKFAARMVTVACSNKRTEMAAEQTMASAIRHRGDRGFSKNMADRVTPPENSECE